MSDADEGEPLPASIDWFIHRIATSDRYKDSLQEIKWQWTLDDLMDAHEVLDAYEADGRKHRKRPPSSASTGGSETLILRRRKKRTS